MTYTLIGFMVYLGVIMIVGLITYRINKTHRDYFIAGRKLNPWVVAFSERASGESAWVLLGLPGAAYATGMLEFWSALGCVLGIVMYWIVIAARLRDETEKVDAITVPDFFARKFPARGRLIRVLALLIIIFFYTFYLAAQFNGAGKVLYVTFGIPHLWGIAIGAVVIVLYTMMGGFFAVAWTDLVQGIIMVGGLIILPLAGFVEIIEQHNSIGVAVQGQGSAYSSLTGGYTGWAGIAVVVSGLSWGLGYFGQPHLLTRFMAIRSVKSIRVSRAIAYAWAVPAFTGSFLIGLVGLTYYGSGAFDDIEAIMPALANDLLPKWLAGILISGAIAAMMSTADSQLLTISSSVIEDLYHKTLRRKNISEKVLLRLSRLITIAVGLLGFAIAVGSEDLIYQLVSYAWAGLGASFGPPLLLMLWWRGTSARGVIAGMVTGTAATMVWTNLPNLDALVSARLVSWILSLIGVYLVSRMWPDHGYKGGKGVQGHG
jgi:sodium/proline symporter